MFHANAWGMPYAAPLTGATLVMPGPRLDGASVFDLMEAEQVFAAGACRRSGWGCCAEIEKRGRLPKGFAEVVIGGSAAPRSMIAGFEDARRQRRATPGA